MKNDTEIIKAIAKGDRNAFKSLFERYKEKVYNTAISYVQNAQDAEEVTQDVFAKLYKYAAKFKQQSAVSTWIYRITVNTALTFLKRKKRFTLFSLGEHDMGRPDFEHPGVIQERKEEAALLFQAIKTLPDKQKTAFILSYVEDLPRQEIADIMETSLKAVESLLQRAKGNLRKKLEKIYPHRRKNNK